MTGHQISKNTHIIWSGMWAQGVWDEVGGEVQCYGPGVRLTLPGVVGEAKGVGSVGIPVRSPVGEWSWTVRRSQEVLHWARGPGPRKLSSMAIH